MAVGKIEEKKRYALLVSSDALRGKQELDQTGVARPGGGC
jgi:hypothetical protein